MEKKAVASGTLRASGQKVKVRLDLIKFEDTGCQIVYCPALDLSGYGKTNEEAEESFKITLEEFFRYTLNKNTLKKELLRLGWVVKDGARAKMTPPDMSVLLSSNRQFRSIFNKHSFAKSAQTFALPAC